MEQEENWDALDSSAVISCQPAAQQKYQQTYFRTSTISADDLIIEIDSRLAGTIIGKGGLNIKNLKKETGAFITVIDGDTYGLKNVKISGNTKAKDIAKTRINEIIDANNREKIREKLPDVQEVLTQKMQPVQSISNFDWDQLMKEQSENLKKKLAALPMIVKDFYKEHPEVSMMSDQEVEDFRLSKNNIMVKYTDEGNVKSIPKPVLSFSHAFTDYPDILKEIQKQKFEMPSPVQCQAWPIIMSGHDLIAIAQTGTGKTLAFLLPAFIHINCQSTPRDKRKGPSILVLAPTRELVLQIESEVFIHNLIIK